MMGTMDAETQAFAKLADVAGSRAELFGLLAGAFRDPTPELAADHASGALARRAAESLAWLGADRRVFDEPLALLAEPADADELLGLKVEFARLFIGPPRPVVSPYASTRLAAPSDLGGPLLGAGPSTRGIEAVYTELGLRVAPALGEPPDHIATELELLYFLCTREAEAWRAADDEAARDWRRRQRDVVDAHIRTWALDFFDEVAAATTEPLYRAAAGIGSALVRMESGAFRPS